MSAAPDNSLILRIRKLISRHWQLALRWRERLTFREEAFHLLLAGVVGVLGGGVNVFFFYAGELVQRIFLPQPEDPARAAESFGHWERLIVPTAGGLAAGLILHYGLRFFHRQQSGDLLEAVVAGDGRLRFRTESVKTASALVSIATGASVGREGGITQLSATLASKLGQLANWPPYRLRLLVGCGAAAGMAAAYNAPIGGAVFAALIVLGNFSMNLFAPLVCSSVIAATVSRSFFGMEPLYRVPAFPPTTPAQLPWFLVLGILCGGLAALFLKSLAVGRKVFGRMPAPIYVKMMLAGLAVGLAAVAGFPGVCGNGYFAANSIFHGDYEHVAGGGTQLAGLLLAKLIVTALTVGAGTVGGVFTPTMFLGAAAGALMGMALHQLGIAAGVPAGAFALVGMGAAIAGTTKSPLLAMLMAFEISLDYSLVPALMLACVVSVLVARQLYAGSVYTEHIRLKGLLLARESARTGAAMGRTVGDLMNPPVPPIRDNISLRQIADRFMAGPNNFLPVIDADHRLLGVVALQDLKAYLHDNTALGGIIASDVMRPPPPCLLPGQRLLDILPVVLTSELRNIPVVSTAEEQRLVGSVSRAQVLAMFSEAIAGENASAS